MLTDVLRHEYDEEPPRFLSQDEVARFLGVINNLRDRALFTCGYLYGLRLSEIVLLRERDVDLVGGRILVRRVKSGIWGIRPLFRSAKEALVAYLKTVPGTPPEAALFRGRRGPLHQRRIQQLFRQYATRAGLPGTATCHSLRHAIATHLLDAGESLEFVKEHLGHRKIENTAIYARVSNPARDRAFARLEQSPWIVHPAGSGTPSSQQRRSRPSPQSSGTPVRRSRHVPNQEVSPCAPDSPVPSPLAQ